MARQWMTRLPAVAVVLGSLTGGALAQDTCTNRGQLDTLYCDENNDLVADAPKDQKKWRDPSVTGVRLHAGRGPGGLPEHLQAVHRPSRASAPASAWSTTRCSRTRPRSRRCARAACTSPASRPGRPALPSTSRAPSRSPPRAPRTGPHGYHLISLVKKDSPYQKLADLKGKRVAHTAPSSNSGHLAPLVLYPPEGLKPNEDYKPLMSGGHDKSALGVLSGDYDMGGVASDVYERMVTRGTDQGRRLPHHLSRARSSRPRRSPTRTTSSPISPRSSPTASSPSASRPRCRRSSTATTASSRSPTRRPGRWCARSPKAPARPTTRPPTTRKRSARPRRSPRSSSKQQAAPAHPRQ